MFSFNTSSSRWHPRKWPMWCMQEKCNSNVTKLHINRTIDFNFTRDNIHSGLTPHGGHVTDC